MILHPIVCGMAFIAFLLSLGSGICGALLAALVAGLTWVLTLRLIVRFSKHNMSTKFLIFVLGTFLLVQCTHGNVVGKRIDGSSSVETNKVDKKDSSGEEVAAAAVILTAVSETVVLVDSTYEAMRTVFQPLIANLDATVNADDSELVEKLRKVKELFEKTDKLKEDDVEMGKVAFSVEMTKIFDEGLGNTEEPAADASELVKDFAKAKKALKADGVKIFTKFSDHIIASADEYWNSLSAEKKVDEKDFYDHLMVIKNEPDLEKKVALLKMGFDALTDSNENKD